MTALTVVQNDSALASLPSPLVDLASHPRFVVWDPAEINAKGKQVKSPRCCDDPNKWASTRKPHTWGSWDQVRAVQQTNPTLRAGYVLTADDQHVFLDLDGCRDPVTGAIDEWAFALVERCRSYVEVTPSGRGLRIIGYASDGITSVHRAIPASALGHVSDTTQTKTPQVEVYFHTPRYVTMTGWRLDGTQTWTMAPIGAVAMDIASYAAPVSERFTNPAVALPDDDIAACVVAMPNPPIGELDSWETYNTVGMAIFAASGGSSHGLACFVHWSRKHVKHDDADCMDRWDHWLYSSPPDDLTGGSLVHHAKIEAKRLGTNLMLPSRTTPPGGWPPLEEGVFGTALRDSVQIVDSPLERIEDEPNRILASNMSALGVSGGIYSGTSDPNPILDGLPPPLVPILPFAPAAPPKPPFDLLSPRALMAKYGSEPEFLIHGVLTKGTTVLLTGLPGAGKSPFAQDIAVRIAMGMQWRGRQTTQAKVIYVAGESARQTTLNFAHFACGAIEEACAMKPGQVELEDGLEAVDSFIRAIDNSLTLEDDMPRLIASINVLFASGGVWENDEPGLIVLDTLRALARGSVSSDEDMQLVQTAVAEIRAAYPKAVVIILHHAAKHSPEGSSGTNRLDGMSETIMSLVMLPPGEGVDCDKALPRSVQWGPDPDNWRFAAFKITMGRNKTWQAMEPCLMTMAIRSSEVRLCYDNGNVALYEASRAALKPGASVFKDERRKVVQVPVAVQEGDDGAFASATIEVRRPLHAKDAGAAAVDTMVLGLLMTRDWTDIDTIVSWLHAQTGLDSAVKRSLDYDNGKGAMRRRLRTRMERMVSSGTIESQGKRENTVWKTKR